MAQHYAWLNFQPGSFRLRSDFAMDDLLVATFAADRYRDDEVLGGDGVFYVQGGVSFDAVTAPAVQEGEALDGTVQAAGDTSPESSLEPLPAPNLPPELFHIVLGFLCPPLSDDAAYPNGAKRDLYSCNLVCRSWNVLVRGLIYHDFAFSFVTEVLPSPVGPSCPTARPSLPTLPSLLQFLTHHPVQARCIRRLCLDCWGWVDGRGRTMELGEDAFCRISPSLFLDVLGAIPSLEDAFIYNLLLEPDMPTAQPISTIRRLRISFYHEINVYPPIADIETSTILGCFSTVKELEVVNGSFSWRPRVPEKIYDGPNELLLVESLVLQWVRSRSGLFQHLSNLPLQTQSLRRIVLRLIEYWNPGELQLMNNFLRAISPQLQELRLYLQNDDYRVDGRTQAVEFESCTQLRELTIGYTLPIFVAGKCNRVLDELIHLFQANQLSSLHQPFLEEVVLEITFDVKNPEEVDSWVSRCNQLNTVDASLLALAEQCGLRGIILECRALGEIDTRATVARMFPRLSRKSLLIFRPVRSHVWQSYD